MYGDLTKRSNPTHVTNHSHKKDVQLSIQLNRWLLTLIGVWPKSVGISWIKRFSYVVVNIICVCLICFVFIPCFAYIILEVDDTYFMLKLTGPLNFYMMAMIKYSSLIYREEDIRTGLKCIEDDWLNTQNYIDRNIMIKNAKFGRRLVTICASFMYGGFVFYYIALPYINGKVTELDTNLTYRPLMYPVAKVIIDARFSPIRDIFFWTQCMSGFVVHSISTGACSLAAVFAIHAYGRLEVLMQWIEHAIDGRDDLSENVDERLAMIVQQHVRILRFIALTDKVLREISLVEMVGCTLSMCFLGYYTITEWENKETATFITYVILLTSLTFNIFILCYIGELIVEQCKKIGEVSYLTDWHRLQEKRGLTFTLVIAMSNSSVKLTAGNLFELSLSTFGDVVKTSVAYLNMLRTLTT